MEQNVKQAHGELQGILKQDTSAQNADINSIQHTVNCNFAKLKDIWNKKFPIIGKTLSKNGTRGGLAAEVAKGIAEYLMKRWIYELQHAVDARCIRRQKECL